MSGYPDHTQYQTWFSHVHLPEGFDDLIDSLYFLLPVHSLYQLEVSAPC